MEITVDEGALPVKKQFITRAFFPLGAMACKEIGIIPASDEVAEEEAHQAYHELMAAVESWSEFVLTRCNWYVQAYEALVAENGQQTERDLTSHLAAFALAVMVDERLAR